ncbi:uncharacterized protein LOC128547502 [Mercenaria mercenaria]|uniref:uncharacterized protein LOC128547502 n=1 Tax=Mercenaria mercenaria TaxID=6596 RepID=UPI00234F92B5|nr:uncharacterized protein LOC128547502 [Mercenaria mercenaria]
MRRSTRKRKAPANFEPDAVAVPPQPAPAPQQAPLPQQAPMMPQPVPVPQPAPVLPQPAPAPRPDPMVPLPEAVVPAPVGPVGNEHPQEVLDQGTCIRLINFDAMANDQPQMVPTARAGL